MTPREYLDQVVRPNIEDCSKDFGNLRLAYNAVHTVDALAAYVFMAAGGKGAGLGDDDTHYRETLAGRSKSFRLLRDVAKVAKHAHLGRGKPEVTSEDQMGTRSLGWGVGNWGEMRWGGPPQAIVITDAGDHRALEAIIKQALAVLEDEMKRLGL